MKVNKKKICFRLNPKLIDTLRLMAEGSGKTKVRVVEDALDWYFKKQGEITLTIQN
jgi:predicted DNA-binding protein